MKRCSTCKASKDRSEFRKNRATKDGLQNVCKVCHKDYCVSWKRNNPEAVSRIMRRNYLKNHDAWKSYTRAYSKENPGKVNALVMKRHAAKLQRTPKWLTKEQLQEIKEFYIEAKELQWLSDPTDPLEVDHIVPLQGEIVSGLHVPWNLQILPKSLNCEKSNKF